jgi:hypothetical protein
MISGQDPISGSCEVRRSIEGGQFLDKQSDYLLIKETPDKYLHT